MIIGVTVQSALSAVGVGALGYAAYSVYAWCANRIEMRRKYAAKLGLKFAAYKATHIGNLLIDYGSGDYSGFISECEFIEKSEANGIDIIGQEFDLIAAGITAEKVAQAAADAAAMPVAK